jgi:nucleoside permease NupC
MQVLVSVTGIAMMTAIAYYISWSRRQDSTKALRAEA